ncbi:hypothetical protein pdam_00016870, partial [Pocillopora damicornis]
WHFEYQPKGFCFCGWPRNTAGCDTLLVGRPANFLKSDVEKNSDLFYKDIADGANGIVTGRLGCFENPLR